MAKESGLGAGFFVDGDDLSGDTRELTKIGRPHTPIAQTSILKFAEERTAGKLDGSIEWTSYFNPTGAHPVLSTLPRTGRIGSYMHKQTVLGTPMASCIGKEMKYDGTREDSGQFTLKSQVLANAFGLEWGYSLTTGKRTDGSATNGTGVDFGSAKNFGGQFYVHVFAFTGTSATIKIQDSADNATFADLTGGTFTLVTAKGSERIQTGRTQTVRRYLRAVTTGTFSNVQFAINAIQNLADYTV